MFRHRGKNRTYIHNLRLASMLSWIAGIVNICGVLAINRLTTNVTGHFAFFAEELSGKNYQQAIAFLLFILSFLFGAFVSNFLIEIISKIKPRVSHILPMLMEVFVLSFIGIAYSRAGAADLNGQFMACALLFAMGIQNSLVTQVSNSTVRTTHLTGLFTDLGIELSQLFFYRKAAELKKLLRNIYLRLTIIAFFFGGCVIGGFLFRSYQLRTLLLASCFLVIALFYDNIRYRLHFFKRKLQSR